MGEEVWRQQRAQLRIRADNEVSVVAQASTISWVQSLIERHKRHGIQLPRITTRLVLSYTATRCFLSCLQVLPSAWPGWKHPAWSVGCEIVDINVIR